MLRVSEEDFQIAVQNLKDNNRKFRIETKRRDKVIVLNGKKILGVEKREVVKLPRKKKRSVVSLFANVKKSFQRYADTNPDIEVIEKHHGATFRNKEFFKELEVGQEMLYVDISHCYWRIAYLLGYISTRMYESVLTDAKISDYKLWRNISLSSTIAPLRTVEFEGEVKVDEYEEDTTLYQIMYKNVRFTAYNIIGEAKELVTEKGCLNYRIDGILILPKYLPRVEKVFNEHDLLYDIVKCRKIDNKHYLYGGKKIKKF